jgi:protein-tyrosine-phosphatase
MSELGVDLASHRSRKFHPALAEEFDLILVMTKSHKDQLLQLAPELAAKVYLLQEYEDSLKSQEELAETREKVYGITDPFGGSVEVYRQVRDEISQAVQAIVDAWQQEEGKQ